MLRARQAGPRALLPSPLPTPQFSPHPGDVQPSAHRVEVALAQHPQRTSHGPWREEMGCRVTGAPLGAPHLRVPALPQPGTPKLSDSSTYYVPGGAPGAGRPQGPLPQEAQSRESRARRQQAAGGGAHVP